ncbi:MAG: Ig-like domain-containing protein, partial [Gallionella sp.]|nr:Ig-like domain-containing protein [Gallionella sp.]
MIALNDSALRQNAQNLLIASMRATTTSLQPQSSNTSPSAASSPSSLSISSRAYLLAGADRTAPTIASFSPANGTTNALTTANISLTFSENIQRGTGTITLKKTDGTLVESFDAAS